MARSEEYIKLLEKFRACIDARDALQQEAIRLMEAWEIEKAEAKYHLATEESGKSVALFGQMVKASEKS